ncbi:MAG: putative metal-binding motif-containing protein [Archangium sp.]
MWWLLCLVAASGCLTAWETGGPWGCPDSGVCPGDLVCDDGVCCQPGAGGSPACPTLPGENGCPAGSMPAYFFRDRDGDGAGDPNESRTFCKKPVKERWVVDGGDCNDSDVGIGPSAPERCNAIDDNCNGQVDEGLNNTDYKRDVDEDGFGDDCATCTFRACTQPPGYVPLGGDCNPNDKNVFPGAPERCNGIDDNCNAQLDDPPFIDVENPGLDGGARFDCDSMRPGVCQSGGMQCVFSSTTNAFAPVCVARNNPSTDVCGNSLDDDCSGAPDDAPGCGGPRNFLSEPGVTIGAFAISPLPASMPTTCLKGMGTGMAWLSPVWIGSKDDLHVWWAEAPAGQFWDLTTATSVFFPIRGSPVNQANEGTWATEAAPVPAFSFPNAVVALCGPNGNVLRYVPSSAARITGQATSLRIDVPLAGSADWARTGNTATLSNVTRVELWMSPRRPDAGIVTFSNTFLTDAGTPGFR